MKIARSLTELREMRRYLKEPLGFVPTMGYLHEGHLALVRRARSDCASVAASIFVNPAQFGPGEDLETYLRDFDRDVGLLQAEGTHLLWAPSAAEMYPDGFQTWVTVEHLSQPLEGAQRPGHFRGVATIVAKLLAAVHPQRVYVGQKDAQQVCVIRRMVRDLDFPTDVIVCPTVREADGLAMSSRNAHLDRTERRAATVLYRALRAAAQTHAQGGRDAAILRARMEEVLGGEPLARVQYVSVADPETLEELTGPADRALLSLAVFLGKTRLIDNVIVGETRLGVAR